MQRKPYEIIKYQKELYCWRCGGGSSTCNEESLKRERTRSAKQTQDSFVYEGSPCMVSWIFTPIINQITMIIHEEETLGIKNTENAKNPKMWILENTIIKVLLLNMFKNVWLTFVAFW